MKGKCSVRLSPLCHLVFGDELWRCIGLPKLDAKDQEPWKPQCYPWTKRQNYLGAVHSTIPSNQRCLVKFTARHRDISQTPERPYPIYAYLCKINETLRSCQLSTQSFIWSIHDNGICEAHGDFPPGLSQAIFPEILCIRAELLTTLLGASWSQSTSEIMSGQSESMTKQTETEAESDEKFGT